MRRAAPAQEDDPMNESADEHTQKMQALQAEQRLRVKELGDLGRGLVLLHTGNGKGKSSSGFGVVARALGWGQRVGVVQFIKGKWVADERQFFERFPEQRTWRTMGEGVTWDTQDRDRDMRAALAGFDAGCEMMQSGDYDLLMMDEIDIVLRYYYLQVATVVDALRSRFVRTSVILTGRDAKLELMEFADLVTDMVQVKHPFESGIKAQKGLDF
jgi:cob(I)alamin adenosyltransferase